LRFLKKSAQWQQAELMKKIVIFIHTLERVLGMGKSFVLELGTTYQLPRKNKPVFDFTQY